MTKAVLIGIGVPFPQGLAGLQSRSTLPSPVPSVASLQVNRAVMSHLTLLFLCVLLPACVLTGRLPGLEIAAVGTVLRAETVCSLPCFTLVLRVSVQNSHFSCSGDGGVGSLEEREGLFL